MRTDLFDFDLPTDRIALRPANPRDSARLMVVRPGQMPELEDRQNHRFGGPAAGRAIAWWSTTAR